MIRKKRNSKKKKSEKSSTKRRTILILTVVAVFFVALMLLVFSPARRYVSFFSGIQRVLFGGAKVPVATAYGIDVSRYQDTIAWDEATHIPFSITSRRQRAVERTASVKISFAFVKATEGGDYVDPNIATNRNGIRASDLLFGAYHVLTYADATAQIANFIRNSGLRVGDLVPVVDIEESIVGKHGEEVRAVLKRVLRGLESHYGAPPIIYCSNSMAEAVLTTEFSRYPLWIARYMTTEKPARADIWQFSDDGDVPGIGRSVDLNALYGNRYSLQDYKILSIRRE